jgi:hypothetical protein
MTKTTPLTALALAAASITPAFAQEASNDDFRAVLTSGYYEGGFRTTIIDGYATLDSCLLQARIAATTHSASASVSCEKDGEVVGAIACRSEHNRVLEARCNAIDLTLPTLRR